MVEVTDLLLFLSQLEPLAYRKMDFEEFCAAAISPYQLEALERWEEIAGTAFQHFEQEGNRVISVEELAQVFSGCAYPLDQHFQHVHLDTCGRSSPYCRHN